MNHIRRYNDFIVENKIPNLTFGIKQLLSIIIDGKTDIFRTFRINKDEIRINDDIDKLYTNVSFKENVKKNGLKSGILQNTHYNETLLDNKYTIKFFFIYDKTSIELEEPKFIILQYHNNKTNKKSDILGFTNTNNINSFYKELTDSTIELTKGDDTYIYQTTNGGNNWEMKNVQMENDDMKGTLDKKELQVLINKNNFDITNE